MRMPAPHVSGSWRTLTITSRSNSGIAGIGSQVEGTVGKLSLATSSADSSGNLVSSTLSVLSPHRGLRNRLPILPHYHLPCHSTEPLKYPYSDSAPQCAVQLPERVQGVRFQLPGYYVYNRLPGRIAKKAPRLALVLRI